MYALRDYQRDMISRINECWQTNANVLSVMPTGAGKTVMLSEIVKNHNGGCCVIAHRQQILDQISLALARQEVEHNIIAPRDVVRFISRHHVKTTGKNYYNPQSHVFVAGVDTLVRRGEINPRITLWIQDEAHHVLKENKWGKAACLFPNAKGLGVTATPCRTDGKSLGRGGCGLFDKILIGPSMRELIGNGHLSDYRIFCPQSDFKCTDVNISKTTGDFNLNELRKAAEKSSIVGDVVNHYLKIANNKLGVTFVVSVEMAKQLSEQFNKNNIPSAVISAKTPTPVRVQLLEQFKRREFLQLINVDLFGEGFDLPAIEVVIFARPTQAYALFNQQFGRALRPMNGKTEAIIIDPVRNCYRHGLPDNDKKWELSHTKIKLKKKDDAIPLRICANCMSAYERIIKVCPYCGHKHIPTKRTDIDFVDGDLTELSLSALSKLRGEVDKIEENVDDLKKRMRHAGLPYHVIIGAANKRKEKLRVIADLKLAINKWGSAVECAGKTRDEAYRLFYFTFKTDVLSARKKTVKEMRGLMDNITLDTRKYINV